MCAVAAISYLPPITLICASWLFTQSVALENGVARQPPMGWTSWLRFGCNTACDVDYDNCISERLYMTMADIMVAEGYRDAGYNIVAVDDCWSSTQRDSYNRLQPDPVRFPSGIKQLADYIHERGLKLGLYADIGTLTCAGYPGSRDFMQLDAETFASWGVDVVKFDGCNAKPEEYATGFPEMGYWLNKTGRPIIYSCEWPMYARYYGAQVNYTAISDTCNVFRALTDVYDSFYSIQAIIDYFGFDPYNMSRYAKPGAWNDPDQLAIGNFGLSRDEEQVNMAIWALWSAPLMMSNDLRRLRRSSKQILLSRNLIAVNQDELGVQARRIWISGSISAWAKPLKQPRTGSAAICFLNRATTGGPSVVPVTISSLLTSSDFPVPVGVTLPKIATTYHLTELFENQYLGRFPATSTIQIEVNPSGVYVLQVVPVNTGDFYPANEPTLI